MNATSPVRVRFAPSPTGFLHIGGVRTALFNFLYARQRGGKFLLRIEDTDTDRSEPRFTDDIMSSLEWLGMKSDEEVLYQSKRLPIYHELAERLVREGLAYRCTCSEEEVEAARERMIKEGKKPMYARTCRDRNVDPAGKPHAIRAKFPLSGSTAFTDLVRGEISFPNEDIDDFVMIRSNGVPTYNFVVVADDIEMGISHVIRGDDHINNTPKQVYLYEALQARKPVFAHLPMILGQDKKKLSKRNGETSTNAYREQGYLPEALLNFLVRLGWSHGDQEVFTMEEMISLFRLENVQVSGAVFNTEKLLWIAGEHMKRADPARLVSILKRDFARSFSASALARLDDDLALQLVPFIQPKVKLVRELAEQLDPLLDPAVRSVDAGSLKWNKDPAQKARIKEAILVLKGELAERMKQASGPSLSAAGLDHGAVDALLRGLCERAGVKLGELTQPLRLFVTGHPQASIGLFDLIPVLPWPTLSARIDACLES
jgi:glutamyl-tRNA synthetase